jgi:RsiW-degrading membrane proteinase PrsW (M82 family)
MLISALLPVCVLIYYLYWKDKGKPEPVGQLVKAFLLGTLTVFLSLAISIPLSVVGLVPQEVNSIWDSFRISFFGAAFPEEIAKFAILWLVLRKNSWFDEKMDGIVYAVCVSMGFAAFENVLYVFQNSEEYLSVALLRAATALPGHFCFGILMGYYYSLARFYPNGRGRNMFLTLAVPILVHGIYDMVLFSMGVVSSPVVQVILAVLFIVFCVQLWKRGTFSIKEHLARDAENGMFDN